MYPHVARLGAAGLAAALLAPPALAQQPSAEPGVQEQKNELSQLKNELAEQRALVNQLVQELQAQRAQLQRMQATAPAGMTAPALAVAQRETIITDPTPLSGAPFALPTAGADGVTLSQLRGTGGAGFMSGDMSGQAPVAQPPAARYLPRAAVAGLGASGITRGALLQSLTPGLDRNLYAAWRNANLPTETGEQNLLSPAIDRYRRPYEGTDIEPAVMQAYLDWEYGLVAQLDRDGTHGFRVLKVQQEGVPA